MPALDELHPDKNSVSPGEALLLYGHAEEALPFLEKDISPKGRINYAIACRWTNRLQAALDILTEVCSFRPDLHSAWNSLGMVREDFGLFQCAQFAYRKAWALINGQPNSKPREVQQIALNLAQSLMRMEKFEEAWPLWELGRMNTSWSPSHPLWSGENDGNVLVHSEGGYGDGFLFRRFLPMVPNSTLWGWPRLSEIPWPIPFIPNSQPVSPFDFSYSVPLLSIMSVMGVKEVKEMPAQRPLHSFPVDSRYVGKWGICWGAEENGVRRKLRSIPIGELEPLSHFENKWVSLYPGAVTPSWVTEPEVKNWTDTAALISSLDLVVSVDTAVAHLACLLGKPTYILLPSNSDWKWGVVEKRGDMSYWWPTSTLIRNTHSTHWGWSVNRLMEMLGNA